jgi:DNA-binding transcriptional LysR family regulator
MDQLSAMRAFLTVADQKSFSEAARALRLSPAAVTRAVAQLETDLGLALLHRTTRSVGLTQRGALYADRCRRILAEVDEARSLARGEDAAPRGLLSLTAPVLFGRLHVLPAVERLMAEHPALTVRLTLVDRVVHLVEEGFDAAVRIGHLPDSALVATPLASVRQVVIASPAYIEEHGAPGVPADLRAHRIIDFEGVATTTDWRFGKDRRISVTVSPRLSVNSADAAIASAIRGNGVTRALSYQVAEALADGRVVRLLEEFEPASVPVSIVYQAARRTNPNIRAFITEALRA